MATTPIITTRMLEVNLQRTAGSLDDSEFAKWVVETASAVVCDAANQPGWETGETAVPRMAKVVALGVAFRAFSNPELENRYGIGPLSGGNSDTWALGFELSEYEQAEIAKLAAPPGGAGGISGLYTIEMTQGLPAVQDTVYVADEWAHMNSDLMPMLAAGDFGAPPEGS